MSAPRKAPAWSTTDAIKQHIIDSGLGPGDLMPTETELCEALGVSRSSVREAIRTLGSLDIVEVRHGHGTFVGRMSLDPLVNGMVFRLSMRGEHAVTALRNVVQTRRPHVGAARPRGTGASGVAQGGRAGAVAGAAALHQQHALLAAEPCAGEQGHAFLDEDRDFHARLAKGVDNQIIGELAGAFWEIHTRALPLLGISTPQDIMDTVEAHEAILLAVESGDVEAYRSAVQAHYLPLQRAIERAAHMIDDEPTP